MRAVDLLVLGGGSGSQVGAAAAARGWDVAVVEPGPLGGACVTRGCVPSKALVHRADLLEEIRDAARLGVHATIDGVDYASIVDAIRETVYDKAERQATAIREDDRQTLYDGTGRFVDERTVAVGDERVRGEHVVVAVGARPVTPPIDGLDNVDALTSEDALWLDEPPGELVIVGGGYVAAELGHVFAAVGTDVTIVGRAETLLPREDETVGETVTAAFEARADVYTGAEATAVSATNGRVTVTVEAVDDSSSMDEDETTVSGDELLVATGRRPNTDGLGLENAGVEIDDEGRVVTDASLETTADNVWALGDVVASPPFKHVADYEARQVTWNLLEDEKRPIEYASVPHAVFTSPQVASVGRTAAELEGAGTAYEATTVEYTATPMGTILDASDCFVTVLARPGGGEVLGCHVVGPQASTIIHEVVVAMHGGSGTVDDVAGAIHVHPALNEVVLAAFDELSTAPYSTAPDWRATADR